MAHTDNEPTDGQREGWKRRGGECGDESEQERSRSWIAENDKKRKGQRDREVVPGVTHLSERAQRLYSLTLQFRLDMDIMW